MSTAEVASTTPEDLLTMPDGGRYELVNGQLVEKGMGAESDWISARIIRRIGNFVEQHGLGEVFGTETGFQCFRHDRKQVRKPDGSFVLEGRLAGGRIPRGHVRIAPDLAIEVISPNDSYYLVDAKVHEYLDAGVRLVWVINPDNRTLKVYRLDDQRPVELAVGDVLDGGDVLPGFSCPLADLFPAAE
jgi:Uma2 family endonuclease